MRSISEERTEFYALLALMQVGLLGIIHTGDLFNLFIFLEIASISSYVLASYKKTIIAIEGAVKYIILGSFGTSMVLLGILLLYGVTGTLNMADMAVKLGAVASPAVPIAFGMIVFGIGIKIAMVPFHSWKPDVVSSMPAQLGAMFCALSTSVGIYAIIRIAVTVLSGSPDVFYYLLI